MIYIRFLLILSYRVLIKSQTDLSKPAHFCLSMDDLLLPRDLKGLAIYYFWLIALEA